jgi:hypothetical protein
VLGRLRERRPLYGVAVCSHQLDPFVAEQDAKRGDYLVAPAPARMGREWVAEGDWDCCAPEYIVLELLEEHLARCGLAGVRVSWGLRGGGPGG